MSCSVIPSLPGAALVQTGLALLPGTHRKLESSACSLELLASNTWKAPRGSVMRGGEEDNRAEGSVLSVLAAVSKIPGEF